MLFDALSVIIDGLNLAVNSKKNTWQTSIANNLEELVQLLKNQQQAAITTHYALPDALWNDWQNVLKPHTIILVTGCHYLCEVFDRSAAYSLKSVVDMLGQRNYGLSPLCSLVIGDVWYYRDQRFHRNGNILSIGGPTVNTMTEKMLQGGRIITDKERYKIVQEGNKYGIYGTDPRDTLNAMREFSQNNLLSFLQKAWK